MTPDLPENPCTVIGAGPAGISAVLWLRTFELPHRWYASDGSVGGMLGRVENPLENYPADNWENGSSLRDSLAEQLDELGGLSPDARHIEALERRGDEWRLTTSEGESFASKTVILATGTRYRHLGVPGESEGLGEYVSQSTSLDAERFGGRTVAIVGGGDAGFEGALQLAERNASVHMLLRNDDFKARPLFVERVRASARIFIHPIPSRIQRLEPLPNPRGCRIIVDTRGERKTLEVACLFVRIGVDPVAPDVEPAVEKTPDGHVVVDRRQRTSAEGLYAIGDVTDTPVPSVAVAVGHGARAAYAAAHSLGWC